MVLDAFLNDAKTRRGGKPYCIVANTVKGKSVAGIEGVCVWHYRIPETAEECRWFRDALYDEEPEWYLKKQAEMFPEG